VSTIPSYLLLSRHSVYYFRIVVPDVIRPLFPQREIRRSLQTRCKREALIRGRDILAQVQGLFTQAFQGSRPPVELLRGAWEAALKLPPRLHQLPDQPLEQSIAEATTTISVTAFNNQVESQIRPWAIGRSNWLFAGSLRSGKRAAVIMSLIQSCAHERA